MRFHVGFAVVAAALLAGCGTSPAGSVDAIESAAEGLDGASWGDFYHRAAELFRDGKRGESVALYYVGQLRGRIRAGCKPDAPDRGPAAFAASNETLGRTINEYAGGDPVAWAVSIDQALAWDEAHPDPNAEEPACRAERARQRMGLSELRQHIITSADQIRRDRSAHGLPNR